ncbi:MAG: hypothetical protein KDF64_13500 [Geminicoccaceae bacterium]|nr:hypothetical protein [Geminicoccaceae bacterium]
MPSTTTRFTNADLSNGVREDTPSFASGDRVILATSQDVTLASSNGNIVVNGANEARAFGWAASEDGTFISGNGDDSLSFSNLTTGSVTADGRKGDDDITGGGGDDTLSGGAGNDDLRGGAGEDTLKGGGGADELRGGSGSDTLVGGGGNDEMWGNGGTDSFTVTSKAGQTDTIYDFNATTETIKVVGDSKVVESVEEFSFGGTTGTRVIFDNGFKLDLVNVTEARYDLAVTEGRINVEDGSGVDPVDPVDPDPEPNTDLGGINGDFFSLLYG